MDERCYILGLHRVMDRKGLQCSVIECIYQFWLINLIDWLDWFDWIGSAIVELCCLWRYTDTAFSHIFIHSQLLCILCLWPFRIVFRDTGGLLHLTHFSKSFHILSESSTCFREWGDFWSLENGAALAESIEYLQRNNKKKDDNSWIYI